MHVFFSFFLFWFLFFATAPLCAGFLMSEEDKTNPVSLGYWFRVVDLDGDGVIRPAEMRHFYVHQVRARCCFPSRQA